MNTKSIFAQIVDKIVIALCAFLLSYALCGRLIKNKLFCFAVAGLFSILIIVFSIIKLYKKNNMVLKNIRNKIFFQNCINFLKFCSKNEYISFVSKIFCSKYISNYYFKSKSKMFYINLKRTQNEKDFFEINEFFCENNLNEIILVCEGFDETFLSLVQESNNKFVLYDKQNFLELMTQSNIFPLNISAEISKKQKLAKYFKSKKTLYLSNISKTRFKDFFFSGTSLIILSIFVPFASYYIYFGTILLIISVICLLNKNRTTIPNPKLSLINQIKRDD